MERLQERSIRILLVDDHVLLRDALRVIIHQRQDMLVIAEAATGAEAVRLAQRSQPDVTVLDLDLGGEDGLQIIPTLRSVASASNILVLTGLNDFHKHQRAARLGAIGLVHKNQPLTMLISAIERVSQGEAYLDPKLVAQVLTARSVAGDPAPADPHAARIAQLTERERAVVGLVCAGLPNKTVGSKLAISETTVRHHLTSIFNKLGVANRVELVLYAYRHGLADCPPPAPGPS